MTDGGHRLLLTFRLDAELRQRLRARLTRDGRTMSEVITDGLRQYVESETMGKSAAIATDSHIVSAMPGRPELPEHTAARLRELRVSGRSGVLSATLAALHADGWPLAALAEPLGVSRQAIQVRVRQRVPAELRDRAADCPPPVYPRRREPHEGRLRPHLTIKIDHGLRAAAHRAAARDGRSLSLVIESIVNRYLSSPSSPPEVTARRARRSR